MPTFLTRPRTLLIAGLVLMIAGAIDPLEGSVVIVLGSALATLGGFLGHSPRRVTLATAFVCVAVGVGLLFGMSALGGVGGRSGHSIWWLLIVLPYPIGWVMGLVGITRTLRAA